MKDYNKIIEQIRNEHSIAELKEYANASHNIAFMICHVFVDDAKYLDEHCINYINDPAEREKTINQDQPKYLIDNGKRITLYMSMYQRHGHDENQDNYIGEHINHIKETTHGDYLYSVPMGGSHDFTEYRKNTAKYFE